jgi:DNA-binding XRE family transcriptional regulator
MLQISLRSIALVESISCVTDPTATNIQINTYTCISILTFFRPELAISMDDAETTKKIDLYVIEKVRQLREANSISQEALAERMGVSAGYIGQIESPKYRAKYNLYHLNHIAKIFNCSPKDFLPQEPI